MSKEESTGDKETGTEVRVIDADDAETSDLEIELEAEEPGDSEMSPETETGGEAAAESDILSESKSGPEPEPGSELKSEPEPESESESEPEPEPEPNVPPKPRRSWFGFFNFLLILLLAGAAGYYWWQQQQVARDYESALADLEQQLAAKAENTRLESSLSPLKSDLGSLGKKIDELGVEQQGLRESSEKLYELYGRDKNDWQLAEVEYLMRVAQHKLILQDDFEGAAITLQAASDRIALTADPGLLPVRFKISEEIADLKTRKRADLVGMTLILAQLRRQVRVLEPGFALRVDEPVTPAAETPASRDWFDRLNAFIDSLVKVRNEATQPSEIEANFTDVGETLEDNLKLARWAVLERDGRQYLRLIDQSLRLFREFYDLDNAANHDFMTQLQDLRKMELQPEKPDITGSLRELQRILSQRENEPQPDTTEAPESGNG